MGNLHRHVQYKSHIAVSQVNHYYKIFSYKWPFTIQTVNVFPLKNFIVYMF